MQPEIRQEKPIVLMGMSFYGDPFDRHAGWDEENQIGRLWKRFMGYLAHNTQAGQLIFQPNCAYEVHLYNEETSQKGLFEVFVGVQIRMEEVLRVPPALLVKILPATTYAVFTFEGAQITSDWEKILESWLLTSGYQSAFDFNFQFYDERFKGMDRVEESILDVFIPIQKAGQPMNDQVEAIFRSIEFVEAHMQDEISVAQMADAAGYSIFHFIRAFNRVTHHTPYDYLMRRRLTECARALTAGRRRIIDISQDYCFNNHETFSRAFKRMFNMQPTQWRENNLVQAALLMPPKTLADLYFTNDALFQIPVMEEWNEIHLQGLMTALDNDPRVRGAQRARVFADLLALECGAASQPVFGLTVYLDESHQSAYYFVGVEKAAFAEIRRSLVDYSLSAGKYVSIQAAEEQSSLAFQYLYFTWLPALNFTLAAELEIERYSLGEGSHRSAFCLPLCTGFDFPLKAGSGIKKGVSMTNGIEIDAICASCSICARLADQQKAYQKYGWEETNTHLPAAASQLALVHDFSPYGSRKNQLQQCLECGTYYLYSTDYEYLVNGSEDEESLTRLTREQAAEYLKLAGGNES